MGSLIGLGLIDTTLAVQPVTAFTSIPERIHEQCLNAKDYLGCVKANSDPSTLNQSGPDQFGLPVPAGSVPNQRQDGTISYFFPNSIAGVKNKGRYGRYITWTYTYHYNQQPRPGYWTSGYRQCDRVGKTEVCRQVGQRYIRGQRGGPTAITWRVFGDCVDYTVKWKNDGQAWQSINKEERNFESDKKEEAKEILDSQCPRIKELPKSGMKI